MRAVGAPAAPALPLAVTVPYDQIRGRVVEYQERQLAAAGDSARGVDWKSEEAQHLLFRAIRSFGIDRGSSVLDVGCGLAHLYDFLAARGHEGRYTGVDVSAALIEQAGRRLPGVDLRVGDVLEGGWPAQSHDWVVASGVFTARLGTPVPEFEEYIESLVRRLFELCRVGVVFNMLTSKVDFEAEHLYYADPSRWLAFAQGISRQVTLKHDLPGFLFTLGIYRGPNDYADW